jgi:hypothetical protein
MSRLASELRDGYSALKRHPPKRDAERIASAELAVTSRQPSFSLAF